MKKIMDSRNILYSKGQNDECYTPRYVVEELLPYLNKKKRTGYHLIKMIANL